MKLYAYGIKSAIMGARWDEVAALLDGHFGLPGLAADLLKKNPRFGISASYADTPGDYKIGAYVRMSESITYGSYYYGWHDLYGFEDWESTTRDSKIVFVAPREVYVKAGMVV